MDIPSSLPDQIADLYGRHADLERKVANKDSLGLVTDVDEDAGRVRVALGTDPVTGVTFKGPWMEVQEIAMGGVRASFLPRVGEQVAVHSATGDLTDATVGFSIQTNKTKRPKGKAGEGVIEADGGVRIDIKNGEVKIAVAGVSFRVTGDGVEIVGPFKLTGEFTHTGNTNQTGVHKDSRGYHK